MTYDVRETPEEVIHTALCCAEGEAAIDEVDERAAREWLTALIAARDMALALAERRAGECDTLRAMLTRREVQWSSGSDHDGLCPICDAWEHDGHAEGCALYDLLAAPPPASEGNGMAAFAGAWPGEETEEELLDTLDYLDGKGPPAAAAGEDAGGTG
jgi:hypothetical protein